MIQTVLIVDDSTTARMMIKRCLEIAGLYDAKFLEGQDGEEALMVATSEKIDLILTDLNMPNMDGRGLVEFVKNDPDLKDIPVVMITSSQNEALEKELKEKGVHRVISKPISPATMAELLKEFGNE